MKFSDYIWFWKTSWSYMKGSRMEFFLGLRQATAEYRKAFLEDKERRERALKEQTTKDV